jgi:hypothetical protein
MSGYELRAELQRPVRLRGSHNWHVVLRGDGEALRDLDGGGVPEVCPIDDARLVIQPFSHRTCFQLHQNQLTRDQERLTRACASS